MIFSGGAAMRHERGSVELNHMVTSNAASEAASVQSNDAGPTVSNTAAIRSLFKSLEQKGVRYCHWKSNIRLEETLAAAEDLDLLVDPRDAPLFYAALLENGLKLTQSRAGIGHPGVFHAIERHGIPRVFLVARIRRVELAVQSKIFDADASQRQA